MKTLYITLIVSFTLTLCSEENKADSSFVSKVPTIKVEWNNVYVKLKDSEFEEAKKDQTLSITKYWGEIYSIGKVGNFEKSQKDFIQKHLPAKSELDLARQNFWKEVEKEMKSENKETKSK